MAHSTDSPMASSTCFKGLGEPPGGPDKAAACSDSLLKAMAWCWLQMQAVKCSRTSVQGLLPLSPAKKDGPESKW